MIRIGPAGIPIACKGDTSAGIEFTRKLGLDTTEVQFGHGIGMKNETADKVGNIAKKNEISLSVHAPYFINLSSAEAVKIRQSMKRIIDSCERAHHMGAKIVVFHPGYFGKLPKERAEEMIIHACQEMYDKIRSNGWHVLLGPETTGKHSAFGSLEETVRLCKKVKGSSPVIDFAHLYARAMGKIDFNDVLDAVKPWPHIHSHFSGINYTAAGERNHLPLSSNRPDHMEIARAILKKRVDITMICESPLIEKDALKMKGMFERLGHKF